jgi:hypothetical protein
MRKYFWTTAIALSLFWTNPARSQSGGIDEADAVRKVAELSESGEPARLELAFDPTANLYTTDDKGTLRVIPFHEYLERVKKNVGSREPRKSVVDQVEQTGDAAAVRITTTIPDAVITDYLSLLRLEGPWKIVSKTFFVQRRAGAGSPNRPEADTACGTRDHHIFDT